MARLNSGRTPTHITKVGLHFGIFHPSLPTGSDKASLLDMEASKSSRYIGIP